MSPVKANSEVRDFSTFGVLQLALHASSYDWQLLADHARLIVDTRNALRDVKGKRDHIVKA